MDFDDEDNYFVDVDNYLEKKNNDNLPNPILTLFLIGFCIAIAVLDLGDSWYETILKILGFLFALSFGFIIYSHITDLVVISRTRFKPLFHLILLLIFPLIIYFALKIYLL